MTEKSFFAGLGGQGIVSLGQLWVYCAMEEGRNVTFFPFYGAEKRGGIARASVIVSDGEIASPLVTRADSALVMNPESLPLCEEILRPGGVMLVNSGLVRERPARRDVRAVFLDVQDIAEKNGARRVANMVALGSLAKLTGALSIAGIENILAKFFAPDKLEYVPLNVKAIHAGYAAV